MNLYSNKWAYLKLIFFNFLFAGKMHLFDIDVKGGICFKESDVLSAGKQLTVLNLDGFKIGIGICYDIRFEELARIYRNKGLKYFLIILSHETRENRL